MGEDPKHIGRIVQWEIAKPETEDNQVVGQPANTEEHSYDDNHSSDLVLGLLGIRHIFNGIHRSPEIADGPHIGEAQN